MGVLPGTGAQLRRYKSVSGKREISQREPHPSTVVHYSYPDLPSSGGRSWVSIWEQLFALVELYTPNWNNDTAHFMGSTRLADVWSYLYRQITGKEVLTRLVWFLQMGLRGEELFYAVQGGDAWPARFLAEGYDKDNGNTYIVRTTPSDPIQDLDISQDSRRHAGWYFVYRQDPGDVDPVLKFFFFDANFRSNREPTAFTTPYGEALTMTVEVDFHFDQKPTGELYAWTPAGALYQGVPSATGTMQGSLVTDFPMHDDSSLPPTNFYLGPFGPKDTATEWDTVLPWVPARITAPVVAYPQTEGTGTLLSTAYDVKTYRYPNCVSNRMVFARRADTAVELFHVFVQRTRRWTSGYLIDYMGAPDPVISTDSLEPYLGFWSQPVLTENNRTFWQSVGQPIADFTDRIDDIPSTPSAISPALNMALANFTIEPVELADLPFATRPEWVVKYAPEDPVGWYPDQDIIVEWTNP